MKVFREGPLRITRATVEAAWRRRAPGQRLVLGDASCRGLALIINSASMTWSFSYKPRGMDSATRRRFPSRSVTIGNPESHSPDDARAVAGRLKGLAKAGGDPAAERRAKIAAAAERRGTTMDRLMEAYEKEVPKRRKLRGAGSIGTKHAAEEIAHTKAAILAMKAGTKPVADIGANDIRLLLRTAPEHPNAARHRFGALNRFFDWCQDEGLLQLNPCALLAKARRPKSPASRDHAPRLAELALIWRAAEEAKDLNDVHRDLVHFLLCIPCRRGEATRMEWPHVDFAAPAWAQPGRLTKNRDAHRIFLHPLALGILHTRWVSAGEPKSGLVFPSPRARKPIDSFTKIKAALLETQPHAHGWRFHDFRRSFATTLGEAGVSETIADAVLNHRQAATRGGVLGVYQRASRWPEQQRAVELWGRMLKAAIEERTSCEDGAPTEAASIALLSQLNQ
jgi:integrase